MDNAATTPLREEVLSAMMPYFTEEFGNASSVHGYGRNARKAIDSARAEVANALGAESNEIYFTSGGTESDNIAIMGIADSYASRGKHIITSAIEHHAVLNVCEHLEKKGYEVSYVMPDEGGFISVEKIKKEIRPDTILITIMFANNEIGTIMPISEIGELAKNNNILFHTDAVQAVGSVPIDVKKMNIDMLSLSAHKINGPKGTGALYVRKGVRFTPLMYGGAHERNKRPGTENVAGIVGLSKAIEIAHKELPEKTEKLMRLRDKLIDGILETIPYTRLNGERERRLAGNANISIEFVEGESLLLSLDMKGVAASSGSACTSGSLDPSHVLLAIGLTHDIAHGSLRFSLGVMNSESDIDYVLKELPPIVENLRKMSPLFAQHDGGVVNV